MSDLKNIQNDYSAKLNNNLSLEEINQIKTELFGKNGLISCVGAMIKIQSKFFMRWCENISKAI